ncbi:MAG: RNase H-like domain-containing protein [Sedimenticola sp.]
MNVKINGKINKIDFHIIDSECIPLIGQQSAIEFGLLKICVNNVDQNEHENSVDEILSEYNDRFQGLGKLKDFQLDLHVDKNVTPVAQQNRRIPFKMRQQVDAKIKELLDNDVIEKAEGPSSWISPICVVPKPNGDIRICVDMRQANTAVERERFPLPNIDEVLEEMNGAKYYSKLDLKLGFHQIELSPPSRDITTFITNDGLYRYKRLSFGVSSAPQTYQRIIQHTIQDIPGCKNVSDDIIVYGKTRAEHDAALRNVLQRLRDKNLTLNRDKCDFCKTSLTYMGHTLTGEGLMPQNSKIEAVLNTKPPKNVKEVKSFLGLVNFSAKFLPNFATVSEPIRKLTRRSEEFVWGSEQQQSFDTLKDLMTSAHVMAFYNPDAETTVIADASPYGLGAILAQKQTDGQFKPVCYASRTLNKVERNFSQIEREFLACTWAITRFRVYLYGITFELVTDHKPIIGIFKPKHTPPARIERMLLRLQSYKFTVKHVPGSLMTADVLSRCPISTDDSSISCLTENYINYVTENSVPKAMTLSEIETSSSKDNVLQNVVNSLKSNRWSTKTGEMGAYYKIRSELTVNNNVVLRGTRLVIPESLRPRVLSLAHETHQGVVKTKQMLREKVFWPGMGQAVDLLIKTCFPCQLLSNPPAPPKIQSTELPTGAFKSVAMDLMGPLPTGESILVVIDYFSRFPEVEIMKSTTSNAIIQRLMRIFATHGLPDQITTDNAPNMVSDEMEKFFYQNGITHKRISPYWPRANGLCENFNKTLGRCIKSATAENKNWRSEMYKFLLAYRTTTHVTTGRAPTDLLYNRTVRNKLPHFAKKRDDGKLRSRDEKQKQKQKMYADRHTSRAINYKLGQKVLILKRQKGKLDPKWDHDIYTVISQTGTQVKLRSDSNVLLYRHVSHTRPYYKD